MSMMQTVCRIGSIRKMVDRAVIDKPVRRVIKTVDGIRINIDTSDFLQRVIYLHGDWDPDISEVLRDCLKPGDTFVDVGANIGFFSLLAAKLVGPAGSVIAFEPNPAAFAALQANAALNGFRRIQAHQSALFDRDGLGEIFIPTDHNCGAANMRPGGQNGVKVPLVRLDDVVKGDVDLIKIDVEGAEVSALLGARDILSRRNGPAVISEISENSLKAMGHSADELYELMAGHGYKPEVLGQVRRSNVSASRVFFQYDVLFIKA